MANPERVSPSAARSFQAFEVADLVALARLLPLGWCVTLEPPHAQIVITPVQGYHFAEGVLVASPSGRSGAAHTSKAAGDNRVSQRRLRPA